MSTYPECSAPSAGKARTRPPGRTTLSLVLLTFVGGCVTPQYDDQTDKQITQLQTDADTLFVTLISLDRQIARLSKLTDPGSQKSLAEAKKKAGYQASTASYEKLEVTFIGLQTRIDAEPTPATPYLRESIKKLHDNLLEAPGSVELTHQAQDVLGEAYLRQVQAFVDAQISALLTRELGLKKGSASGSSTSSSSKTASGTKPAASR